MGEYLSDQLQEISDFLQDAGINPRNQYGMSVPLLLQRDGWDNLDLVEGEVDNWCDSLKKNCYLGEGHCAKFRKMSKELAAWRADREARAAELRRRHAYERKLWEAEEQYREAMEAIYKEHGHFYKAAGDVGGAAIPMYKKAGDAKSSYTVVAATVYKEKESKWVNGNWWICFADLPNGEAWSPLWDEKWENRIWTEVLADTEIWKSVYKNNRLSVRTDKSHSAPRQIDGYHYLNFNNPLQRLDVQDNWLQHQWGWTPIYWQGDTCVEMMRPKAVKPEVEPYEEFKFEE